MNSVLAEKIQYARNFFEIKDYPGNFFDIIKLRQDIYRNYFFLFKEDIGKLSGFIGYGANEIGIICINYKRPIGHQNFTLCHELGHMFLHKGELISDSDSYISSKDSKEKDANAFASELLYPEHFINEDRKVIREKNWLDVENRKELANFINSVCHKYCISFDMALRKLLYPDCSDMRKVKKEIESAIGMTISKCFDADFYKPNDLLPEYQRSLEPYDMMREKLNKLVAEKKISLATAESIKLRNGIEY